MDASEHGRARASDGRCVVTPPNSLPRPACHFHARGRPVVARHTAFREQHARRAGMNERVTTTVVCAMCANACLRWMPRSARADTFADGRTRAMRACECLVSALERCHSPRAAHITSCQTQKSDVYLVFIHNETRARDSAAQQPAGARSFSIQRRGSGRRCERRRDQVRRGTYAREQRVLHGPNRVDGGHHLERGAAAGHRQTPRGLPTALLRHNREISRAAAAAGQGGGGDGLALQGFACAYHRIRKCMPTSAHL